MNILHVDDSKDILMVVKTILEKEGYKVTGVNSGAKALDKIDKNNYSLVILDTMMPDMSGWELFNRISQIKPTYRFVFLSVLEMSGPRLKELKEAGVSDYIRKPFDMKDFAARIKKAIKLTVPKLSKLSP
jgi:DNA-binding response OmpR family regulator